MHCPSHSIFSSAFPFPTPKHSFPFLDTTLLSPQSSIQSSPSCFPISFPLLFSDDRGSARPFLASALLNQKFFSTISRHACLFRFSRELLSSIALAFTSRIRFYILIWRRIRIGTASTTSACPSCQGAQETWSETEAKNSSFEDHQT
ncbi:unnamed protein product [Tuber melanosporum]|uniref:(Perigord truffle) hypothetical protein n=1 Tax=Tuber melanosporum (strain Mel28) TaxID=656061 RepID=D5G686_TUBMM|nr:uncharacterized protein GSTUM_00001655001 [Tuber melanosporum]CAZ80029.1 unnamed protein product [Tuber melanosporum]